MLERHDAGVDGKVGDGVEVHQVTLVPVIRDALMAGRVFEVRIISADGVEGFEYVAGEKTFGVLFGLVGHEAVDEGPGGGGGGDAAEGGVEEVGVVVDGFLEAGGAVVGQDVEVDGVGVLLAEFVEGFELGHLEEEVVAAEDVVSIGRE